MKITHLVRQFYPLKGGLEGAVYTLAKAQVELGHDVEVITLNSKLNRRSEKFASTEVVDLIKIKRVNYWGSSRYPIAPGIIRYLRKRDVLHVHAFDFFADFLALISVIYPLKMVISTHGGFFHTSKFKALKKIWFNTITRWTLSRYRAVLAVSQHDKEIFRTLRKDGLILATNAIDVSLFLDKGSAKHSLNFITIGRFARNKRLDRAIEFISEVSKTHPCTLVIVGPEDDLSVDDLNRMTARAGGQPTIEVRTGLTNDELVNMVSSANYLLSASEYEGFGITAIEGLAAGLEVVLSDIPPYQDLVKRLNQGLILNFEEPIESGRKFVEFHECIGLRSQDEALNHREKRIAFSQKFSPRSSAQSSLEIYSVVLGRRTRNILGNRIDVFDRPSAVEVIGSSLSTGQAKNVFFANSNLLNQMRRNGRTLQSLGEPIVLNDGIALDAASRLLYGKPFPENLNGTDFMDHFLAEVRPSRVYLLGATEHVVNEAKSRLEREFPQHEFVGAEHGFFSEDGSPAVTRRVSEAKAEILLCAMGNPRQELWLASHLEATGCAIGFAVGAYFDFKSGRTSRAPVIIRKMRLEWLYRLLREPRRLAHRYCIGGLTFGGALLSQIFAGYRI